MRITTPHISVAMRMERSFFYGEKFYKNRPYNHIWTDEVQREDLIVMSNSIKRD